MISDRALHRLLRSDHRVQLYGDLARALAGALLFLALLWGVRYNARLAANMYDNLQMNDFGKFYYSARAFLDGRDMYAPNPATTVTFDDTSARLANMNPPHFHLLLLPIARLSPRAALLTWTVASLIALAAMVATITRELKVRWTWTSAAWTLAASLTSAATATNVVTGQMTFLLLVPITLAWIDARRDRWHRAAMWLGLAASVKPFLLIFGLYLLVKRRWSSALLMGVVGVACLGVGLLVFHRAPYETWLKALGAVNWAWLPMNGSIQGMLARSISENPLFAVPFSAPGAIRLLGLALSAAIVSATMVLVARDRSESRVDRAFALLLLAALLASPLGWMYYLWLLAGPAAALAQQWHRHRSRARDLAIWLAVPGLFCPTFLTLAWSAHRFGGVTLGSLYFWSFLSLWSAFAMPGETSHEAEGRAAPFDEAQGRRER